MSKDLATPYGLRAILIRDYQYPGWCRRRNGRQEPISGWRYVLHRILWGYTGLVYIPQSEAWNPFQPGALDGWSVLGALIEGHAVTVPPTLGVNFVAPWVVHRG